MSKTAEIINEIRRDKKLTQAQFANVCGMSLSTIRSLEQGKRKPTLKQVFIIAKEMDQPYEPIIWAIMDDFEEETAL